MKKEFEEEEDDGRTIVNMNVDGMPWYKPWKDKADKTGDMSMQKGPGYGGDEFTPEQVRAYRWAALKAALLVALLFGLVFGLFIAFLDFIVF
ncbi:hypothetical protein [Butyrivibrio sp. MC2013]|uniref:hypothetical protein n=1 Tax=Butyrivibrio sp. MC2013 TaxID=1280686 RepID=UPI00042312E6|nr:hypothetical protein [Butyrivibrio sp. MC2013]